MLLAFSFPVYILASLEIKGAQMENPISKHVGIWIRVSTEDQAHGESPEHHERRGDFRGSHTAPDQLRPLSARSPHDKNNLKSDAALQLPLRTEVENFVKRLDFFGEQPANGRY